MKCASLEVRLEQAWDDLTAKPVALYLLPWGDDWLIATNPQGARHIGTYTEAVTLPDFRADVFETLHQMRPA